jgi:hypothetical protein
MMSSALLVFVVCCIGTVYSYALYPALLLLMPAKKWPHRSERYTSLPRVTHIIACRNEERRIREKLENALAIDYPNLETLVASDASDDASERIVEEYAERGVRLVRSPERRGKEFAQRLAVSEATGELIVFSDAGTSTPASSVASLVEIFADPTIGAVSSEDTFVAPDGRVVGEGAYVRYEMWLRRQEARVNSLVGLSGSFFAVRRPIAVLLDPKIPSDFACGINAYRLGYRAVSSPLVRGIYTDVKDAKHEFGRKVRTATRGMAALARIPDVLSVRRYGIFAFQIWSHKVMRWLVPWFMLGALASTAILAAHSPLFRAALLAQGLVYALAAVGHLLPSARGNAAVRLTYYFFQANAALLVAAIRFATGERVVTWNPSIR